MGVVAFLGLYQGAVPLVVRGLFDRDQRFAPALWLSAPWWWIACIVIVVATLAILALLAPDGDAAAEVTGIDDAPAAANGTSGYDALSGLVLLVGVYNGVAPFVARLVFDSDLLLAFPLRLAAPWWWVTSLTVIAVAVVLLAVIDAAKQRRHPQP